MERDSATGLDHTLNRQYSSQYGRWLSPDPMGGGVTIPQSLNRYAYVANNPASFVDPLGLRMCALGPEGRCTTAGGGVGGGGWITGGGDEPIYTVDGDVVSASLAGEILHMGAGCLGSCTSSVTGNDGKTYTVVQTAGAGSEDLRG